MPNDEREVRMTSPVRVAFAKVGSLSFISHLDLMRTVSRMLVRADIGVYYTEGFNPHPKLTFALPLSVGTESVSELFDIKVYGEADTMLILERLRREAPKELPIREVYVPERKFRDIAYAEYEIVIHHRLLPDGAAEIVGNMTNEPVVLTKRTKSGEQECDIREFIASLGCEMRDEELFIKARLAADPEHYLNPEYVVTAARRALSLGDDDIAPGADGYFITRTGIFDADGKEFR